MSNSNLLNYIEALSFVGSCFGIGEKELEIYRQKLKRARDGKKISEDELARVRQMLFYKIREKLQTPVSRTTLVTHEIVVRLTGLYERLLPHLDTQNVEKEDVAWVLTEHVFLPTCFLILREKWQLGLGTEFRNERCWYLPEANGDQPRKPVQRVLDCWLRVAGFRTAHGVSRKMPEPETYRRKISRWLEGKCVPSVADLHSLVAKFGKDISWLDEPDEWKSRFTFACAAQKLFDEMDESFKEICKNASLKITNGFRELGRQQIFHDADGVLVLNHTFFATRLIEQRLRQRKEFDKILSRTSRGFSRSFGPEVPDSEIEAQRAKDEWEMNPGNWFADYLRSKAKAKNFSDEKVAEFIFKLGVEELNKKLAAQKSRRA